MFKYGKKGKFLVIVALTLIFFWSTMISLKVYFIREKEPRNPIPTCAGGIIHEDKCYFPTTIIHCHPLAPTMNVAPVDQITQLPEPTNLAGNAILYFALTISILSILVQIAVLNGWWKPWGERAVWKKGRSRWGLTVRPAERKVVESEIYDEKMSLLVSSR